MTNNIGLCHFWSQETFLYSTIKEKLTWTNVVDDKTTILKKINISFIKN